MPTKATYLGKWGAQYVRSSKVRPAMETLASSLLPFSFPFSAMPGLKLWESLGPSDVLEALLRR